MDEKEFFYIHGIIFCCSLDAWRPRRPSRARDSLGPIRQHTSKIHNKFILCHKNKISIAFPISHICLQVGKIKLIQQCQHGKPIILSLPPWALPRFPMVMKATACTNVDQETFNSSFNPRFCKSPCLGKKSSVHLFFQPSPFFNK